MKLHFSGVFTLLFLIGLIFSTACGGESAKAPVDEEKETGSITNTPTIEKHPEEDTSSIEQTTVELSDQLYTSPSGSFQIIPPKGWNCSETGEFQVNCQTPDQTAELQARITATGYELVQEAFLSFTHAELVHAYSEIKEYVENKRFEGEGRLTVTASWREGEIYWKGTDVFIRTGGTVFHLQTAAQQESSGIYDDVFTKIAESAEIFPSALLGSQLYANRKTHTARDAIFEIDIPTAWVKYEDAKSITKTIIEGFFSPDMRASVQIAVYWHGELIEQALKAEKTLEIMRTLYGHDLRISHDKALPDGRERLEWYAPNKDIHGISYFDSYGSSLYVLCIVWEETTEKIYLPLLEEIAASFSME
jgi:hypothetical protein